MSIKIIITNNFQEMSDEAAKIVLDDIKNFNLLGNKENYILGLATGNSPIGIYKNLANYANNNMYDPTKIVSFNLDEYIGLPGNKVQERVLHPESFASLMKKELFGLLNKKFKQTYIPKATEIDQEKLINELEKFKHDPETYEFLGKDKGKQILIKDNCKSKYLKWIKKEIIEEYIDKIKKYGGIDLHIIGVGERGHVAFHESGIPLNQEMLLVKLDDNTINNAIVDGHFSSIKEAPKYAVSMGIKAVFKAKTILLVANGKRKIQAVAESLLGPITKNMPLSYSQKYASEGGKIIYVIENDAAKKIMDKFDQLKTKGYEVVDKR